MRKIARGGDSVPVPRVQVAQHAVDFDGEKKSRTTWPWRADTRPVIIEGFREYMLAQRVSEGSFRESHAMGMDYLFFLLGIGTTNYYPIGVVQALHDQKVLEQLTTLHIMNPIFSWTRKMMNALKHAITFMLIECDRNDWGPTRKALSLLKATTVETVLKACTAKRKEAKQARKELDEKRLENYMSLETARATLVESATDLHAVKRIHEGKEAMPAFWQRVASVAMAWQMVIPGTFGRSGELNGLCENEVLESKAAGYDYSIVYRHKAAKTRGKLGRYFTPAMWGATDC
jgi:hypothetical protein